MTQDLRCCNSGTCIIDAEGRCWCGQQWDGQKMVSVPLAKAEDSGPAAVTEPPSVLVPGEP